MVSTILLFLEFAKSCFNEGLGRCPVCKRLRSTAALVKIRMCVWGNSGLLFILPGASRGPSLRKKTNRVAKTQALESDRSGIASLL